MAKQIFTITANGVDYSFINEKKDTKNGFSHVSTLPGYAMAKCCYLNRTYERYCFQSSMMQAVSNAIADIERAITARYKAVNSISRITAKSKPGLYQELDNDRELTALKALYTALK